MDNVQMTAATNVLAHKVGAENNTILRWSTVRRPKTYAHTLRCSATLNLIVHTVPTLLLYLEADVGSIGQLEQVADGRDASLELEQSTLR